MSCAAAACGWSLLAVGTDGRTPGEVLEQLRDEMVGMSLDAAERLLEQRMDAPEHKKLVERFLDELGAREKA